MALAGHFESFLYKESGGGIFNLVLVLRLQRIRNSVFGSVMAATEAGSFGVEIGILLTSPTVCLSAMRQTR